MKMGEDELVYGWPEQAISDQPGDLVFGSNVQPLLYKTLIEETENRIESNPFKNPDNWIEEKASFQYVYSSEQDL